MLFSATWVDSEIIKLSEVRQRQISCNITYLWNLKKMIKVNLFEKWKQTHRKQIYGFQRVGGRDKLGV